MISKKHHEVGMCRRGSEASIACLLNRKLGVPHVALVLLERRVDPRQLFQYLRQRRSIDALWDPVFRAASLMFCGARMLANTLFARNSRCLRLALYWMPHAR